MRPCTKRKLGPTVERPCLRVENNDDNSERRLTSDGGRVTAGYRISFKPRKHLALISRRGSHTSGVVNVNGYLPTISNTHSPK